MIQTNLVLFSLYIGLDIHNFFFFFFLSLFLSFYLILCSETTIEKGF